MHSRSPLLSLALVLGTFASALTGCRDSASPAPAADRIERPPVTIDLFGETLEIDFVPQRLYVASSSILDLVLALVEPRRIAAVSQVSIDYSNAGRGVTDWSHVRKFERYHAEEVLAVDTDLLLVQPWSEASVTAAVRETDIAVLSLPPGNTVDEIRESLLALGVLLDASDRAESLVASLDERIAALEARMAGRDETILGYSNFGTGGTSPGTGTSYDALFGLAGLRNGGAEAGIEGFGDMNHEILIDLDPDWILVGGSVENPGHSASRDFLLGEPVLQDLRAIREGRILMLPAELWSTTSHYLVDAAEGLVDQIEEIEAR